MAAANSGSVGRGKPFVVDSRASWDAERAPGRGDAQPSQSKQDRLGPPRLNAGPGFGINNLQSRG